MFFSKPRNIGKLCLAGLLAIGCGSGLDDPDREDQSLAKEQNELRTVDRSARGPLCQRS